jgi:hypothetical protein
MSVLGHKQTFAMQQVMSALPPIADIRSANADVRFGPEADICSAKQHVRFTRKRSVLGGCCIFLDAFVMSDQPEGKAKDHSDVVYNQMTTPQSAERCQSSPDG